MPPLGGGDASLYLGQKAGGGAGRLQGTTLRARYPRSLGPTGLIGGYCPLCALSAQHPGAGSLEVLHRGVGHGSLRVDGPEVADSGQDGIPEL